MGTVTIRLIEHPLMMGTDSRGSSVVIGRSPDNRSEFLGVKPSDFLLLATASCSAYDIAEILGKQREPMGDLRVDCTGEQESEPPYKFTSIHLHYIVRGAVQPEKLEKAIKLSENKYCSVINTLRPAVLITSSYEVI